MPHHLFEGLPDTALVSTSWLEEHLGADDLVVLDATVIPVPGFKSAWAYVRGQEQYLNGHIPGTVFADLFDDFSDPEGEYAFTRPSIRQFEREAQAHGIDNDTAVVVYDGNYGIWAARLWWLFKSVGFDVRVLDGGLTKWRAEGRAIETGDVRPRRAGEFSAYTVDDAWASKEDVESVMAGATDALLLCALPKHEFDGAASGRPRAGHIPASVNVPVTNLTDRETAAFLPPDVLRELFGEVAQSPAPIIAYCGGGIASAGDALALGLIGRHDVRIYDGSLNEWAADPSAPLETAGRRPASVAGRRPQHSAAQK